jgi:hypothetical protein
MKMEKFRDIFPDDANLEDFEPLEAEKVSDDEVMLDNEMINPGPKSEQ